MEIEPANFWLIVQCYLNCIGAKYCKQNFLFLNIRSKIQYEFLTHFSISCFENATTTR